LSQGSVGSKGLPGGSAGEAVKSPAKERPNYPPGLDGCQQKRYRASCVDL